ncbi:hypothetical protein G6F68_015496 [Rhizopus microsporus]|nr:hypothetical protein G6F68_015496 [Rhizopus microsporus]
MRVFGIVQAGRLDGEDLQDGARDDPERFHRAAQDGLVAGFQDAEVELAVQVAGALGVRRRAGNEVPLQGDQIVQLLARDVLRGLGRAHAFQMETDLLDFAQLLRIHVGHIDRRGGLHLQALLADQAEDGLAYGRDGHAHFLGQFANDQAFSGFVLPVDQGIADFVVDPDGEVLFLYRFEAGHDVSGLLY